MAGWEQDVCVCQHMSSTRFCAMEVMNCALPSLQHSCWPKPKHQQCKCPVARLVLSGSSVTVVHLATNAGLSRCGPRWARPPKRPPAPAAGASPRTHLGAAKCCQQHAAQHSQQRGRRQPRQQHTICRGGGVDAEAGFRPCSGALWQQTPRWARSVGGLLILLACPVAANALKSEVVEC